MAAAIGLTVGGYFLFTLHDAAIKWLVESLTVWQILCVRSVAILAICIVAGGARGVRQAVATPARMALLFRGAIILVAWLCYYSAARDLQFAELVTLYYCAPIAATALAIPLLGERVTAKNWAAVAIGFAGVVVACSPWGIGLTEASLLALTAAVFWGLGFVLVRKIALVATTLTQMFYANAFFLVATGTVLAVSWQPMEWGQIALVLALGILGALAQFVFYEGVRRASAATLAPFEYTGLIWAFALGYLVWGDTPSLEVFVGAALILAGGLFAVL